MRWTRRYAPSAAKASPMPSIAPSIRGGERANRTLSPHLPANAGIRNLRVAPGSPLTRGRAETAVRSARRQTRDRARLAGQFQNVQAGVGTIREIDVAAVVGLGIVALDRGVAATLLAAYHA